MSRAPPSLSGSSRNVHEFYNWYFITCSSPVSSSPRLPWPLAYVNQFASINPLVCCIVPRLLLLFIRGQSVVCSYRSLRLFAVSNQHIHRKGYTHFWETFKENPKRNILPKFIYFRRLYKLFCWPWCKNPFDGHWGFERGYHNPRWLSSCCNYVLVRELYRPRSLYFKTGPLVQEYARCFFQGSVSF